MRIDQPDDGSGTGTGSSGGSGAGAPGGGNPPSGGSPPGGGSGGSSSRSRSGGGSGGSASGNPGGANPPPGGNPPDNNRQPAGQSDKTAEAKGGKKSLLKKYGLRVLAGLGAIGLALAIILGMFKSCGSDHAATTGPEPTAKPTVTATATAPALPTAIATPVITPASASAEPQPAAPRQCAVITADLLKKFFYQADPTCFLGTLKTRSDDAQRLTLDCSGVEVKFDDTRKCSDVTGCKVCLPPGDIGKPGPHAMTADVVKAYTAQSDPSCFINPKFEDFHAEPADGFRIDDCKSLAYDPVRNCYDYSSCSLIVPSLTVSDAAPATSGSAPAPAASGQ